MPATTRTWSASGTWARRPTDPGRARLRARLLAARRGGQLLGHDEFHRVIAEVAVHGGRPIPDELPKGYYRRRRTPTSSSASSTRTKATASRSSRTSPTRPRTIPSISRKSGATAMSANTTRDGTPCAGSGSIGRSNSASCRRDHPLRTDVVSSRPDRPGSCDQGRLRQEDGALCRHGGEPGLPRRAAHRAPEGDRRVREHDFIVFGDTGPRAPTSSP